MVDPIDLMLLQRFQDLGVKGFGRSQVVTEGLLDDDSTPLTVTLRDKLRGSKRVDRRAEEALGDREIEQAVACRARRFVQSREMLAQPAIGLWIVEIAGQVAHPLAEPLPRRLCKLVEMELAAMGDVSFHCISEVRAPLLRAHLAQVDADETKFFGQLVIVCQVVAGGHAEALRQVAGCPENHHDAGRRHGRARALLRGFCSGAAVRPIQHRPSSLCQLRPSSSVATETTRSGSKPNLRCNSLSGAEAPKVFMPMTRPAGPT